MPVEGERQGMDKLLVALLLLVGCSPTVKMAAPDKPIEINLNINHNIKVQMDKELEDLMKKEDKIF